MLILNTKHLESRNIFKLKCDDNWEDKEEVTKNIDETLQAVLNILNKYDDKNRCIFIFNVIPGDFPPFFQTLRIIAFLIKIKQIIYNSLNFTIIYMKTDETNFFNLFLSYYTPVRPIHIAKSKEEISDILNSCITV